MRSRLRLPSNSTMFPPVDTKNSAAVAALVEEKFATHFPGESLTWFHRIFRDVETMFVGGHPDYHAIDLRYHDLEHTLQATACLALIFDGCKRAPGGPAITARQFQLGIAAVLLHDVGYLKLRSDATGTGAKYTYCHVLRSCAFASSYLPLLGATELEIAGVMAAINCTGPLKEVRTLHFQNVTERFVGYALATADYLGQMSAPDYPDELGFLYAEFEESDDYLNIPLAGRAFKSAEDLSARTPEFWRTLVLPKLEREFAGAHRYLATPTPDGLNPYLEAVTRNIAIIERRIAALSCHGG